MRFSRLRFIALAVLALVGQEIPAASLETGEIGGAKFAVARPEHWNRRVLLLAHGLRPVDRPLVADLFPEHLACKTLLAEGWIVAKTSYRRNGLIVADAIADLDALRAWIEGRYGTPERVLIEGESMGGYIATLIAERDVEPAPLYHGVIAIGAALHLREPESTLGLSLRPQIPVVFLSNQSELDGSKSYVANATRAGAGVRPTLFRVSRDGHVNVNQRERLAAVRAMNDWLDRGRGALPEPGRGTAFVDVTLPPAPVPSQVKRQADGRGFDARVVEISAVYGNVLLNAQPEDFAAAGIEPMAWCELRVGAETYRVRHGRDFGSVPRGEWVVFPNADGFYWLARNFGDAAAAAKLKAGDGVALRRSDPSSP